MIYSVKLKCGTQYYLHQLEEVGVSYVPCGQIEGKDQPIFGYRHLWGHKRQVTLSSFGRKVRARTMLKMTGVQIMTGYPTYLRVGKTGYIYLNDIDIEHRLIEQYPDHYRRICDVYRNHVDGTPCEIETKSGGRRLSAYTPYLGKKIAFSDPNVPESKKPMLLEIFAQKGLSRIDHRYSQVAGSLLDIPTMPRSALIEIHNIIAEVGTRSAEKSERVVVGRSQINDLDIQWNSDNRSQLFPTEHCPVTGHTSNREEIRFTRYPDLLSATGEPCVDGICFNCGSWWWEIPPPPGRRRGAPIRLFVSEHQHETQSLEIQRFHLRLSIEEWIKETENAEGQYILNVTYAAGIGKTTITVETIDTLLYISPTKDLADQAYSIAYNLERIAWRHRPRMYNRDDENWETMPLGLDPDKRPCIYPEICNNLALRGYDPVPTFCAERCPFYNECKKVGFLAQPEIEKQAQSVFMSYDEVYFSDVRFKSRVEYILNNEKILVADEPTPDGLTQKREIIIDDLLTTFDTWRFLDQDVLFFLKRLIENLSTAKAPEQIRSAIERSIRGLNDEDIKNIDDALSKIPVGVVYQRNLLSELYTVVTFGDEERTVAISDDRTPPDGFDGTIPTLFIDEERGVEIDTLKTLKVTLDTFDRMGFVDITTDALKVPRAHINLFRDLKTFIESESKACQRKDEKILFTLPPGLNAPRGITLTASDTDNLIGEVYDGTRIHVKTLKGPPPPFQPGCKYYQIATGRYTPASGLLSQNNDEQDDSLISSILSPMMRRMLTVILKVADSKLTLVVGPKALEQLVERHEEDILLHQIYRQPNIDVINHYHAEGSNDYENHEIVFVFHFEPSVSEVETIARQVFYRNHDLSFKREETDIVVDGITLKKVMRYKDERVQKVFNRECERRLMQALMRLRPMLHPNKLLFLLSAEPVSRIPIAPVPFTLPQLERFVLKEDGDVAVFDEYLVKLEDRSVKEVQQQDRVSQRWAYKTTEEQRQNDKEALKAEVYRLYHEEKLTQSEIENRTGINQGTISRWLKKMKS